VKRLARTFVKAAGNLELPAASAFRSAMRHTQHWPIFGTHTPAQPPPNGRHAPTQHRPAPQQSEGAMPEVSSRALLICRATGLAWIGNFMAVLL
jgi:hypothetical protein